MCLVWPLSLFLLEFLLSFLESISYKYCFEVGLVGPCFAHEKASMEIFKSGKLVERVNSAPQLLIIWSLENIFRWYGFRSFKIEERYMRKGQILWPFDRQKEGKWVGFTWNSEGEFGLGS